MKKSGCPRGEIGRHNGLKIRAFLECQFESGRGHQKFIFREAKLIED